jgi:formate transporter
MFFLPLGHRAWLQAGLDAPLHRSDAVDVTSILVTLGNIVGWTVLVALVYWFVYLRTDPQSR